MEPRASSINRMTVATQVSTLYGRAIHCWAYIFLGLWSLLLGIFTVARLIYTLSPRGDTFLNNGAPFYEPTVAELLACAFLGLGISGWMVFILCTRHIIDVVTTNGFEIGTLSIFWLLTIGGAGSATSIWPDLSFCIQFSTCRVLQAMMGWAWLCWITTTLLLLISLYFSIHNKKWNVELHKAWEVKEISDDFSIRPNTDAWVSAPREVQMNPYEESVGRIDANNYEYERWRRAAAWVQESNQEKELPVASMSANQVAITSEKKQFSDRSLRTQPRRSKMARNEEKAQSMLYRFREAQAAELGLGTRSDRRPRMASSVKSLRECERWRGEILREISRKVSKIQDAGLSDYEVRDLNDEINKLMREKRHWENQIIALGGANYRRNVAMLDADGKEVPGTKGYKYFGRAKELPGVKELFESKKKDEDEDQAVQEFYKKFTGNGPAYYGDLDEADGELLKFEKEAEAEEYREAVALVKETFNLRDDDESIPPLRTDDVVPISSSAVKRKDKDGDEVMGDRTGPAKDVSRLIPFLTPEHVGMPKLPTKQEMDGVLLELRKQALLQEYIG